MRKIFRCLLLLALLGCSINNESQHYELSGRNIKFGYEAYSAFQKKGDLIFNYFTEGGTHYWMWGNFNPDGKNRITISAQVKGSSPTEYKEFYRHDVNIIYHQDLERMNEFIIDFGKVYDYNYLPRFMYIKKTGDDFRGKMLNYIKWDVQTDFEILNGSKPTGKPNPFYDNVTTDGDQYMVYKPLPFGDLPAFDTLRNNDVVRFTYYQKDGISYHMWLDLMIGLENNMELIYHKVGITNTRYRAKRPVVDIFYNEHNLNEFIIDLGVANGYISRYIYVKKTGTDTFSGAMSNIRQWDLKTTFNITKDQLPWASVWSDDYLNVTTTGTIEIYSPDAAGEDPRNYNDALAEAVKKIDGVDGFTKFSSYFKTEESELNITHYKDFYFIESQTDPKIKYTYLKEYNGTKSGHVLQNYFGERTAVGTLRVDKIDIHSSRMILYKGKLYDTKWLQNKGYEWYTTVPAIHMVTNNFLGGDNIWKTLIEDAIYGLSTDFLIKRLDDSNLIILDLFQSKLQEKQPPLLEIRDKLFDIDNPSIMYHYRKN